MKLSPQDKAMLITFSGASILAVVFLFFTIKPYDTSQVEEFIPIPIIAEELPEEELPEDSRTQIIANELWKLHEMEDLKSKVPEVHKQSF